MTSHTKYLFWLCSQPCTATTLINWPCSFDTSKTFTTATLEKNVPGDPFSQSASFLISTGKPAIGNFSSCPLAELNKADRKKEGGSKWEGGSKTAPDERGSEEKEWGKNAWGQAAPSGAFVLLAKGLSSSGGKWWHHRVKHGRGGRGHCSLLSPWQQVHSCSCASFTSSNKPLFYSLSLDSFQAIFSLSLKTTNYYYALILSKEKQFPRLFFLFLPDPHVLSSSLLLHSFFRGPFSSCPSLPVHKWIGCVPT